jgi:hypothetical protein
MDLGNHRPGGRLPRPSLGGMLNHPFYVGAVRDANTNPQEDGEAEAKACMSCTEYNASSSAASLGVNSKYLKKGLLSIPPTTEVALIGIAFGRGWPRRHFRRVHFCQWVLPS